MKTFILILSIGILSCSDYPNKDLPNSPIHNNQGFKDVITKQFSLTSDGNTLMGTRKQHYNEAGYLESYEIISEGGSSHIQGLFYNDNNLIVKFVEEIHEIHKTTITTNEFVYDQNSNLREYTSLVEDGINKQIIHNYTVNCELDSVGRITTQFIERGKNRFTWHFKYDANSNILEVTHKSTNGTAKERESKIEYVYNLKNQLVKSTGAIYRPLYLYPQLPYDGNSCSKKGINSTTEFNEKGDIIKMCETECIYAGFDKNNNWVSKTITVAGDIPLFIERQITYY
ncbi:MAG: hypothetical protein K0R65_1531 [Crocinitomicaceae bacterium]|jgi:hypothetical protein|nr:hypothetical protein [Crocinitomicaceae bacterium]